MFAGAKYIYYTSYTDTSNVEGELTFSFNPIFILIHRVLLCVIHSFYSVVHNIGSFILIFILRDMSLRCSQILQKEELPLDLRHLCHIIFQVQ